MSGPTGGAYQSQPTGLVEPARERIRARAVILERGRRGSDSRVPNRPPLEQTYPLSGNSGRCWLEVPLAWLRALAGLIARGSSWRARGIPRAHGREFAFASIPILPLYGRLDPYTRG